MQASRAVSTGGDALSIAVYFGVRFFIAGAAFRSVGEIGLDQMRRIAARTPRPDQILSCAQKVVRCPWLLAPPGKGAAASFRCTHLVLENAPEEHY